MMMMMMRLGNPSPRSLSQGKDCNTLLGDGNRCTATCSSPLLDNLISRIWFYSYSSIVCVYLEDLRGWRWFMSYLGPKYTDLFAHLESWIFSSILYVCFFIRNIMFIIIIKMLYFLRFLLNFLKQSYLIAILYNPYKFKLFLSPYAYLVRWLFLDTNKIRRWWCLEFEDRYSSPPGSCKLRTNVY